MLLELDDAVLWRAPSASAAPSTPARRCRLAAGVTNAEALGRVLYTDYVFFFQGAGLVLLVAMIGAIVLTLRHKPASSASRSPIRSRARRRRPSSGQGGVGRRDHSGGCRGCVRARRRFRQAEAAWTIGLGHYLTVAACLFTLGMFGIFLNRKNVIIILMSIELILLAVNINFVAFSDFLGDLVGQVFALFVLTVAAAEAAIGLAILVVFFRNRGAIAVEDVNMMKG